MTIGVKVGSSNIYIAKGKADEIRFWSVKSKTAKISPSVVVGE